MSKSTVLVIDDDDDNLEILEATLDAHGFVCTKAGSFASAKALLTSRTFDALVSDFSLGDGDAIQLMEGLGSARPRIAVLVTGYGAAEDRARSKAAGFDAHLVKPIVMNDLVQTLRRGLDAPV